MLSKVTFFYESGEGVDPLSLDFDVKTTAEVQFLLKYLKVWNKRFNCLGYVVSWPRQNDKEL